MMSYRQNPSIPSPEGPEAKLRRLRQAGATISDLSKAFHCSRSYMRDWLLRLGIPTRLPQFHAPSAEEMLKTLEAVKNRRRKQCSRRTYDAEELQRLRDQGLSFPEIGRIYDRHHTTILHACRSRGIK